MRYEYIRAKADMGDLSELNNYSMNGWRVIAVIDGFYLLERPIPGGYNIAPSEISKIYGKNR